ncbi:hypothetical protein [Streptomyces antibioticus]|uniref:hypothetical protein n=1 Tax=Streptomyces antibioticus TaxID=1890 RepID=UPI003702C71D
MPARRVRPRLPEVSENQRRAAKAWNGGMTGTSRATEDTPVVAVCTADLCGTPATGRRLDGMVKVTGAADGAPAHWYCPGRCTAIATARADLRAIPLRRGGDGG